MGHYDEYYQSEDNRRAADWEKARKERHAQIGNTGPVEIRNMKYLWSQIPANSTGPISEEIRQLFKTIILCLEENLNQPK